MRANRELPAVTRRMALGGLTAGIAAACGCLPRKDQLRSDNVLNRIGGRSGEVIEPKKCGLRMVVLARPYRDPILNEAAWRMVDEQSVSPAERLVLQANGIRIGRITGELPRELETLVNAPPPNKVDPITFLVPEGMQELMTVSDTVEHASLLLNLDNRVTGRDYTSAGGYYRVTPEHHSSGAVMLRMTPEIHHGAVHRSFESLQPLQQTGVYAPQEFKISDGQRRESLRDLTVHLVVEPNQVVVLGCYPDQERSLGSFLFTAEGDHVDSRTQRLILIWAARNQLGVLEAKAAPGDDRPVPGGGLAGVGPTPAEDEAGR